MANISKLKRDKMINYLKTLKTIHNDDESIRMFNEIEDALTEKKYGLVFEEHTENIDDMIEKNIPVFIEDTNKSFCSNNEAPLNFLIEGDNLQSLYLLNKTHKNGIDCIIIDPPYNTGEDDFIYNDCYIDKEDSYSHSKWLSFMKKRLKIAWGLLNTNGSIFLHINDNEQANLKLLCDEIFGENNFVNCIAVKMSEPTGVKMTHARKRLPKLKEYILFYKKNELILKKLQTPKENWDNEYKTIIKNISEEDLEKVKEIIYTDNPSDNDLELADKLLKNVEFSSINELFSKDMTEEEKDNIKFDNAWRIVRDVSTTKTAKTLADNKRNTAGNAFTIKTTKGKVYIIKNGYNPSVKEPRIKLLFADNYLTVSPGDFWQDIKTTGLGDEGGIDFTNGKKPLKSEMRLLELINNKNATILDFFAGSGTIGEAVLEMNKIDGGQRKFILATLNEITAKTEFNYLLEKGFIETPPKKNQKTKYNEWVEKFRELKNSSNYKNIVSTEEYQNLGICKSITYKRMYNIKEKYNHNLKYLICNWIPRNPEDCLLSNQLVLHTKEMIELKLGTKLGNKDVLILNKSDIQNYLLNKETFDKIDKIWINQNIVLNSNEMKLLKQKNYSYVPKAFFGEELKEVAE